MYTIPAYSNNASMPVWVTINEATDIINRRTNSHIKDSDLWRYALYGHLPLSIYFQSQIKLRKVCLNGNEILLEDIADNIIDKLSQLSDICLLNGNKKIIKTEDRYISPEHHIIDTPLIGHEHIVLQRLLANALKIPEPITGQYNFHYGVLVRENGIIYQVFESATLENRIAQRLAHLSKLAITQLYEEIKNLNIKQEGTRYFPVHHFPDDAWFVIKRSALEQFINTFFPYPNTEVPKASSRISTPLSRLLWLACKHNQDISSLIEQPYKLISVFEEWARSDGITERLNGDTLKTALQRGSPSTVSTSR
ncbi:hypothetical protein EHN46_23270 [Salmonella enterica]|nr:hypothetical protein [Salmonella enterica]